MIALISQSLDGFIDPADALIWKCPPNKKFFKSKVKEKNILVGRVTFESFPFMERSEFHVFTYEVGEEVMKKALKDESEGQRTRVITKEEDLPADLIVCGGASIYDKFIVKCSEVYLSTVKKETKGNVEINKEWFKSFVKSEVVFEDKLVIIERKYK